MTKIRTPYGVAVMFGALLAIFLLISPIESLAQQGRKRGPTFPADFIFRGSDLTGWETIGAARWTALNGEIVGTPTQPNGGWLLLDQSFQDLKIYTNVLCVTGCETGIMLHAEKTADGGLHGVFFSLTEGDLFPYRLTVDARGNEVSREKIDPPARRGGPPRGDETPPPSGYPPGTLMVAGSPLPPLSEEFVERFPEMASRPVGVYTPGAWNEVELLLSENNLTPKFNGAAIPGNVAGVLEGDDADGFGQVAFYIGGTKEVRFNDLRTQDILKRTMPPAEVSRNYRMQQLNDIFYSWTAAAADFNHDGAPDVAGGPFIYFGPGYTVSQEIATPEALSPIGSYPLKSMIQLADDFTGDGWPDLFTVTGNSAGGSAVGMLSVNPRGASRHWKQYPVVQPIGNEDTMLADIDGDGKPEVIHAGENMLRYSEPDPANPTGAWITKTISEPGMWGAGVSHGLGVGDINGDGRMDFLASWGWWEQPADNTENGLWTHHPEGFGRFGASQGGPLGGSGGADLAVYDVNGDGLNDVVTTLEGHGYGLAWFEQKRDASGAISFVRHMIMDNFLTENAGGVIFTQPHAGVAADMDGDGIPDYITGKRFMSHPGYSDPDSFSPEVLYVYHTVRDASAPGGAKFVPELISNRSGAGSRVVATDLNGDGTNDIAISANSGTFVFFNHTGQVE